MSQEFGSPPFLAFIRTRFVLLLSLLILPHTSLFNDSLDADPDPSNITTVSSNHPPSTRHHQSAYRYVDTLPAHQRDPHSYAYATSATFTAPEPLPLDFPTLYALLPLLCRPRQTRRSTQNTITPISLHPVSRRAKYGYSDQNLACQNLTIEPPRYQYSQIQVVAWPSRDPIGERGGINLYGMVGNAPIYYWDYLGLAGVPPVPAVDIDSQRPSRIPNGVDHTVAWEITPGPDRINKADLDGMLVQKVTVVYEIYECEDGENGEKKLKEVSPVTFEGLGGNLTQASPIIYWEAWNVRNGKVSGTKAGKNIDRFIARTTGMKGFSESSTCGQIIQKGEVTFYQGATMPDSIPFGGHPMAGGLNATGTNPEAHFEAESLKVPWRAGAIRRTHVTWNNLGELCKEKFGENHSLEIKESSAYPVSWDTSK